MTSPPLLFFFHPTLTLSIAIASLDAAGLAVDVGETVSLVSSICGLGAVVVDNPADFEAVVSCMTSLLARLLRASAEEQSPAALGAFMQRRCIGGA